jgi:hypothetical protein
MKPYLNTKLINSMKPPCDLKYVGEKIPTNIKDVQKLLQNYVQQK